MFFEDFIRITSHERQFNVTGKTDILQDCRRWATSQDETGTEKSDFK